MSVYVRILKFVNLSKTYFLFPVNLQSWNWYGNLGARTRLALYRFLFFCTSKLTRILFRDHIYENLSWSFQLFIHTYLRLYKAICGSIWNAQKTSVRNFRNGNSKSRIKQLRRTLKVHCVQKVLNRKLNFSLIYFFISEFQAL